MSENTQVPAMRTPPHSEEAERGVLGSILLDASRVLDLCVENGLADPESFYVPAHRTLYATLQQMSAKGEVIDMLTVLERLRADGQLEGVGGAAFLEGLMDATPTAAHAEYYIDIVRQKALLRRTLDCVRDVERECYQQQAPADQIVAESEQKFLAIAGNRQGGRMSWKESLVSTFGTIERILRGGVSGISTGFENLDSKLRGLRNGEMIVLAARPSMGKTSLAMNIVECLALGRDIAGRPLRGGFEANGGKVPVAVFSLEMSQESLAMRMLCARAQIPGYQLDGGRLNAAEAARKFSRAADELGKALLYVDDTGGLDVLELRARARRMKKAYGIGLIMIDYLQLLNCREYAKQGRQLETSAISAQIKTMAKELNIPVIVLSQLSRAPEQRGEKTGKPRLSDLRDSGAIEQDADVVLLLRRPCKYPGDKESEDLTLAIVDVAKHRNGPVGEVRLNFDDKFTQFTDRAEGFAAADNFDPVPGAMPEPLE